MAESADGLKSQNGIIQEMESQVGVADDSKEEDVRKFTGVSHEGAAGLMRLLFQRGYFQDAASKIVPIKTDATCVEKQNFQEPKLYEMKSPQEFDDKHSTIIPLVVENDNKEEKFMTIEILTQRFSNKLESIGRWSVIDAAAELNISPKVLTRNVITKLFSENSLSSLKLMVVNRDVCFPLPELTATTINEVPLLSALAKPKSLMESSPSSLLEEILQEEFTVEVLTFQHLTDRFDQLQQFLETKGCISLADVSETMFKISLPLTYAIIHAEFKKKQRIADSSIQLKAQEKSGSFMIVTKQYLEDFHKNVIERFQNIQDREVSVSKLSSEMGWDYTWVMDSLKEVCMKSGDSSSDSSLLKAHLHGDVYVPSSYVDQKRQAVWDAYSMNGYITSTFAQHQLKILPSQMREYLLQEYEKQQHSNDNDKTENDEAISSSPIFLRNIIIHPIILLTPLHVAIQEAFEASSWVDLEPLIPVELLEQETDDVQSLIDKYVLKQNAIESKLEDRGKNMDDTNLDGTVCVKPNGAIYLSAKMISKFTKSVLPVLLEAYSKKKAKTLFEEGEGQSSCVGKSSLQREREEEAMTAKEKRKYRKERKGRQARDKHQEEVHHDSSEYGTLPLSDIVQALIKEYPELSSVAASNPDEDSDSILSFCCKNAFYTDEFESMCRDRVQKDLDRLHDEAKKNKMAALVSPTTSGLTVQIENIQAAFEDPSCFASSCYMIQATFKFLAYAEDNYTDIINGNTFDELKKEFLLGCCADFTRRLTQFSLFKNHIDEGLFSFEIKSIQGREGSSFEFYTPVDIGIRSYGHVFISADPTKQGSKAKDPLPLMRETLPGTSGVLLARQWVFCGGECYQGGTKKSPENDDEQVARPGDLQAFMEHVQENCLSICGLPFTKLDKKAEKRFLNARRQLLLQRLEEATAADVVLDLSIMLLYQLVKNMVVMGRHLRGPILKMLTKERKVSEEVVKELMSLSEQITNKGEIGMEYIQSLKSLVMGRDKAK